MVARRDGRFASEGMVDADVRRALMREQANDFIESMPLMTDRAGKLTRLFEQAFRAGVASARNDADFTPGDRFERRMTDLDLPPATQKMLHTLRIPIFGVDLCLSEGSGNFPRKPPRLCLVAFHASPAGSPARSGNWRFANCHGSEETINWKPFGPLVASGLYSEHALGASRRMAIMTEWGYELLKTGSTTLPDMREAGISATFDEFMSLRQDSLLVREALVALDMMARPDAEEAPGPRIR